MEPKALKEKSKLKIKNLNLGFSHQMHHSHLLGQRGKQRPVPDATLPYPNIVPLLPLDVPQVLEEMHILWLRKHQPTT